MKSPKTLALLLLAPTTIGGAILAWQQYQELVGLRAAAMNTDERAALQKRLWDLERANRALNDRLLAQRAGGGDTGNPAPGDRGGPGGDFPGGPGGGRGRGGNPMQMLNAMRDLMAKPEVQALINVQQKAAIEARYAALFKSLNLTADQADKVKTLLADRQTTAQDVMNAAREQGVRDPSQIRSLMADAQGDLNTSLKSVLGDAGFGQLQTYEQTMPQRNVVTQLQSLLSTGDTPLTTAQADQLVQVLAQNPAPQTPRTNADGSPAQGRGGAGGNFAFGIAGGGGPPPDLGGMIGAFVGGGGPGGGTGGPTATISTAAVSQAQSVLAAPQLTALQQLQQQQQAQQQLAQIIRDTMAGQVQTGGAPNNTGAGTARKKGGE